MKDPRKIVAFDFHITLFLSVVKLLFAKVHEISLAFEENQNPFTRPKNFKAQNENHEKNYLFCQHSFC